MKKLAELLMVLEKLCYAENTEQCNDELRISFGNKIFDRINIVFYSGKSF